jgi:hypothetical protein
MDEKALCGLRTHLDNKHNNYRFYSWACNTVDLTVKEANFLRRLLLEERDNCWVEQNFGTYEAFGLARRGLVENLSGKTREIQSDIWRITDRGADALLFIVTEGLVGD